MCTPLALAIGAVAGSTIYQTSAARKSAKEAAADQREAQGDPAAERAKAEAEAAQRANAQLADSNRRRREQGSLMSKGAPTFSMGDATTDPGANTLSATGATTRSTVAQRAGWAGVADRVSPTLMSRGAPTGGGGGGRSGGGGGLQVAMR